jgi:hypothetical protein
MVGVTVVTEGKGLRIGAENSEAALSTCRRANLLYACVSLLVTAGYRYDNRPSRSFGLAARG